MKPLLAIMVALTVPDVLVRGFMEKLTRPVTRLVVRVTFVAGTMVPPLLITRLNRAGELVGVKEKELV